MYVDFNLKVKESNLGSNSSKENFFNIFEYPNCFIANIQSLDTESSLKVASFFAKLYSCGNFKDEEIENCLIRFIEKTKSLSVLEVLYYTSFNNHIDYSILRRIISLDKDKESCLRIFEHEGTEYCPKDMMICIVNGAELSEKSVSSIYKIMRHFKVELNLSLFPQGELEYDRWHSVFNYCIENNCVSDDMIKYLKDCSSDENGELDHRMLEYLYTALKNYL